MLIFKQDLPVVFLVLVLGDGAVVHEIEEGGEPDRHLDEGSDPAVLGQAVLVVPAPVSPEMGNVAIILASDLSYLDKARP